MSTFKTLCNTVIQKKLEFRDEVKRRILSDLNITIEEAEQMGFCFNVDIDRNGRETVTINDGEKDILAYEIKSHMQDENGSYVMAFTATPRMLLMEAFNL